MAGAAGDFAAWNRMPAGDPVSEGRARQ